VESRRHDLGLDDYPVLGSGHPYIWDQRPWCYFWSSVDSRIKPSARSSCTSRAGRAGTFSLLFTCGI